MTQFAAKHRDRLTLISRFHADAALYAPPPKRGTKTRGRPAIKGERLPTPAEVVQSRKRRQRLTVSWYGGKTREVAVITGTGMWYRSGEGVVEVLWVFVQDRTGTHRDEYFFTTDLTLKPAEVISLFTGRWAIEVMFQEVRSCLGMETTRGWAKSTILRAEPCLFCLYSIVVLWWGSLPEKSRKPSKSQWFGKQTLTFSDAIRAVRRDLWSRWIFETPSLKSIAQNALKKVTGNAKA